MIPNNPVAPRTRAGAGAREARWLEVLARWPVLPEQWARDLEARRTAAVSEAIPSAPTGSANAVEVGITPLQAINRALGLPDDHGADEVARRRGEAPPGAALT